MLKDLHLKLKTCGLNPMIANRLGPRSKKPYNLRGGGLEHRCKGSLPLPTGPTHTCERRLLIILKMTFSLWQKIIQNINSLIFFRFIFYWVTKL